MSITKLNKILTDSVADLKAKGLAKGDEMVITGMKPANGKKSVRYFVKGYSDKQFVKMNSNSYLGMSLHSDVMKAEEEATNEFGVGPGAVRFISGTYKHHIELEEKLAKFHGKESGMIFSSAYVTS